MRHTAVSDELIINGFRRFDAKVTKEYFYGYCRKAYGIYDYKYQLRGKAGLDFYSLAHEYYIQLLQHDFRQLTDRPAGTPLATWMTGGFRYVVLEALKAYNAEFEALVEASADEVVEYVRSAETDESFLYDVADAVCRHYQDRTMQEIAHLVLFEGYKQKEVAEHLGITPAAVNQRYKKMMDEVITPFVMANYSQGIAVGSPTTMDLAEEMMAVPCAGAPERSLSFNYHRQPMQNLRITPVHITSLRPNEIFVFGSNLQGIHAGGAARAARLHFGAVMGQGIGLQGQSYAIPTMQGGVETIRPYVDDFIAFAKAHSEWQFLVTPIGCGIAGFDAEDVAPLFIAAKEVQNISLPKCFWEVLL